MDITVQSGLTTAKIPVVIIAGDGDLGGICRKRGDWLRDGSIPKQVTGKQIGGNPKETERAGRRWTVQTARGNPSGPVWTPPRDTTWIALRSYCSVQAVPEGSTTDDTRVIPNVPRVDEGI